MPSVYLIFGEDEYRVSNKAREIINQVLPEEDRTFGLEVIDGAADKIDAALSALGKTLEALRTVGFFSDTKVTWLRDASFFTDNVVGRNDEVKTGTETLAELLKESIPEGQVLVITSPKVHKAKKFYKTCKDIAEIHEFAVSDKSWQNEKDVAEFLRSEMTRMGMKMNQAAGTRFLEKVGTNSRYIVNELEKLSIYLGDTKEAAVEDIEAITSSARTSVAWDLSDAVGTRDMKKALTVMRQLIFQKESAIGLVAALNSRIKDLMIYRQAMDCGWLSTGGKASWNEMPEDAEAIFEALEKDPRKVHPYRLGLLVRQAQKFKMHQLKKCQRVLMETHQKLVRSSMPDDIALELMLIRMLS